MASRISIRSSELRTDTTTAWTDATGAGFEFFVGPGRALQSATIRSSLADCCAFSVISPVKSALNRRFQEGVVSYHPSPLKTPGKSAGETPMTGQQRRAAPHRTTHPAMALPRRSALLFWAFLALPAASFATTTLDVSADYQHQSNSNIWDLAPGAPPIFHPNDPKRGDSYNAYGGTLAAGLIWSRQSLSINIDGHDYQYQHFTDLNHQEYKLSGDWNWAIGPVLDGSFGANRNRNMVPF